MEELYIDSGGSDTLRGRNECASFKEIVIGIRGTWWPDYAYLVSNADGVVDQQVGGFNQTEFGKLLKELYSDD